MHRKRDEREREKERENEREKGKDNGLTSSLSRLNNTSILCCASITSKDMLRFLHSTVHLELFNNGSAQIITEVFAPTAVAGQRNCNCC